MNVVKLKYLSFISARGERPLQWGLAWSEIVYGERPAWPGDRLLPLWRSTGWNTLRVCSSRGWSADNAANQGRVGRVWMLRCTMSSDASSLMWRAAGGRMAVGGRLLAVEWRLNGGFRAIHGRSSGVKRRSEGG